MSKSIRIYLVLLGVVILVLSLLQLNKTEIIDWRKSFDVDSKSPFGISVFNDEVDELLNHKIERISETPYEYFSNEEVSEPLNILIVTRYVTEQGWKKMLDRIHQGDHVFVVDYDMNPIVMDTLNFDLENTLYQYHNNLKLTDRKFENNSIYIKEYPGNIGIGKHDPSTTKILGTSIGRNEDDVAVFIEVAFGKGKLFYHTEPMMLSNFYMLNDEDYKYTENVFSYLPDRKTLWFQHAPEVESSSVLRFILNQKPLRYAWYLSLFSLFLFVIFHAKRRQRVVPIIEPLRNTSAEFVKTIGNLYLQEGSNKDMAHKKAVYFLNRVRTELLIDTTKLDSTFSHRLQLKTGAKQEKIDRMLVLLEKALHEQAPVQQEELIELNQLIDEIYQ
ncbi:hypothetical protein NLM59_00900 [Weeksellaceae bacterium KMM 9724]|uniref:hypothetical protein n=1 Tax=Profundicola chukchiensis TaxID=2961959 RepID=UPI002438C6F7|nr:hypothetical protein [Profundicola chukchiensis]MDG4949469.1 hypothetical protein [Profundicola chukchiensis]